MFTHRTNSQGTLTRPDGSTVAPAWPLPATSYRTPAGVAEAPEESGLLTTRAESFMKGEWCDTDYVLDNKVFLFFLFAIVFFFYYLF